MAEVRNILNETKRRYKDEDKEPLYEQKRALEHVQKFVRLTAADTKKLFAQLKELPLQLTDEQAVKIADLLPETVDDVRAIFAKERFKYKEDEIKQITDLVDQYR